MINPWIGVLLAFAATGSVMAVLHVYQTRREPSPEMVRKLMHVASGLIALSFPWLFDTAWPVLLICAVSIVSLRIVSTRRLSSVLDGVGRKSLGDVLFPVTVALLFLLADGDALLYSVPIAIMTFADAGAALIGVHYGKFHYDTPDGKKSTEGSIAFFLIGFLSVHVPLILSGTTGRAESLLISGIIALMLMIVEALGWKGADNILVPLMGFLIFKTSLSASVVELSLQAAIALGILVFILASRKESALYGSSALLAVLIGYLTWTLGGWRWLLAPAIFFVGYMVVFPPTRGFSLRVGAVVSVCAPGFFWLILARITGRDDLIVPYVIAYAVQFAMSGVRYVCRDRPDVSASFTVLVGMMFGTVPYVALFAPLLGNHVAWPHFALLCASSTVIASVWFQFHARGDFETLEARGVWTRRAVTGGIVSLLGLFRGV